MDRKKLTKERNAVTDVCDGRVAGFWVIDGDENRSVRRPKKKKKKLGAARAERRKLLSRTKTTVGGKEGGGNALHMLAFV